MSTSLAEQLKKLALPESYFESEKKIKTSLLFDPSEAARLDKDAFFEIGLEGLKGLVALEPAFEKFNDTLFNLSSRFLSRTVETVEINKKLDKKIQKFLRLLSPYLLLKHSHKALEWLIYRYHIHNFNVDDLMALIFPYHETKIFVKVLQLFNLNSSHLSHWKWLGKLKNQGLHLPKSVVVNHALSDSSFLRFICDHTLKTISENKKYNCAHKLGTLMTFYASTLANIFTRSDFNNHHLTIVLPSLIKAFHSNLLDFKASAYIIAGQLISSNQVANDLLETLLELILNEKENVLENERALLLLLIFQTQVPSPQLPPNSIGKLSLLSKELSTLSNEGVQVGPLALKIVETCLEMILNSGSEIIEAQILSYTIATEVHCDLEHSKALIYLIDSKYDELEQKLNSFKESDLSMLNWMKELMNSTVEKHKGVLDKDFGDKKFNELREKWKTTDELILQETVLSDLMKKCQGENRESAWMQLRPLLLNKIKNANVFEALCKVAPFYDNLVLLLCLNKLLNPRSSESEQQSALIKISKSRFGENNPHVQEILNRHKENPTEKLLQTIETYFLNGPKESENSIEFEPWLATLQELQRFDLISEGSDTWHLGLKILLAALPEKFNATYALQLMTVLASLKILKLLIEYSKNSKKTEYEWYDLSGRDSDVWLKVRFLEYVLEGIHKDTMHQEEYNGILNDFSKACFINEQEFVRLLAAVCCGVPADANANPDYAISPELQIYALHVSWNQLKRKDESVCNAFKPELNLVLCYLLMALNNESPAIRLACLHVLRELVMFLTYSKAYADAAMFERLLLRFEEISLDANQVSVALYCSLSPSESVQATLEPTLATFLSGTREKLLETITAENTPSYVSLGVMQLLDSVNSPEIIEKLIKLAEKALNTSKDSEKSRAILSNFWSRINETTVQVVEKEKAWRLVTKSIKHEKCDGLSPAVSFLKCMTREVFDKLPLNRKFQLVECMIETRWSTESPAVASAIASVIKRINLDCEIILPMVKKMLNLFTATQKRRESIKSIQPAIIESKDWKNGISLLELIQSKKRLANSEVLIEPLFSLLKFCLDQDVQNAFEYAKQLVLGCLLDCCKKLSTENESVNKNNLNVELVVQCLRASPNPQTHHHALMLLSYLSAIIPKQVIHNVMAIFTFMGTSVARMDDEHSVKVVTQVVEAVVPVLVKAISTEHEDDQVVVAEILRVFVWAIVDIPQHRRKPLLLQLLNTLQPENCLWIFLLLLLENHVVRGDASKQEGSAVPMNHSLGLQLCLSAPPKIVLQSVVKIINYLMGLPTENMNREGKTQVAEVYNGKEKSSDGLFDVDAHTPKQLRHFCYTTLTFLNGLLADNDFVVQVGEQSESDDLEEVLKETIASVMKYTPVVKKQLDELQTKFWKAMTHQCYEILDKFILLVPNDMLLNIIKKLLNHSVKSLRRKALDLLNTLLQQDHQEFSEDEIRGLMELLDPIVLIIDRVGEETDQSELLLQQTALITLKLLAKTLSAFNIGKFKKILINICQILKFKKLEGPLLGSLMLAVAELVTALKAHSVSELPVFMPLMLKEFSKNSNPKRFNELGLNSITLAIHRVVDVLPNFLSPYLDGTLFSVCTISVKVADKPDLLKKLVQIRQKLASNVEHRILIPAIRKCYEKLIASEEYEATGPLFSVLSTSLVAFPDVAKIVPEMSQLFMAALSFRSDSEIQSNDKIRMEDVDKVEQNVIEALVQFILKLSESSFKPFYYHIFHWANEHRDRSITFFRLSHSLAESLKGLFVLFAGHFLQRAAYLLDAINLSKTDKDYFDDSENGKKKSLALLESIVKTLHSVFLYDSAESSNFLNKDKFEVLLHPLVDQLENTLGGIEELERRTATLLTPCLAQMALASDDTLWKSLNYQILLKTKSLLPQVRIGALETIVAIAGKLGEDYLMLLPETIGSLAELLEDENEKVENAMKEAIRKMEDALGQPIREYFQ